MILASGFVPFTTIDFPGQLAAVIFTQGCSWRCDYCHNPHLQPFKGKNRWDEIYDRLKKRRHILDGVVFSGGEALLQKRIVEAILEVKSLGYKVGLHTTGMNPIQFQRALPYLDWVGMDVKASFAEYAKITKVRGSGALALKSAKALLASDVPHEFRTTIHPSLFSIQDVLDLAQTLSSMGATDFALQKAEGYKENVGGKALYNPDAYATIKPLFKSFTLRF